MEPDFSYSYRELATTIRRSDEDAKKAILILPPVKTPEVQSFHHRSYPAAIYSSEILNTKVLPVIPANKKQKPPKNLLLALLPVAKETSTLATHQTVASTPLHITTTAPPHYGTEEPYEAVAYEADPLEEMADNPPLVFPHFEPDLPKTAVFPADNSVYTKSLTSSDNKEVIPNSLTYSHHESPTIDTLNYESLPSSSDETPRTKKESPATTSTQSTNQLQIQSGKPHLTKKVLVFLSF